MTRRWLLSTSAMTGVAALASALMLPADAAKAACTPAGTPAAQSISCDAPLDTLNYSADDGNDTITFTSGTDVGDTAGATVSGGGDEDSIVLLSGNGQPPVLIYFFPSPPWLRSRS